MHKQDSQGAGRGRPLLLRSRAEPQKSEPFSASLEALLTVAHEEARTDGFALYERDPANGEFTLRCVEGLPIREASSFPALAVDQPLRLLTRVANPTMSIVTFPLRGRYGLAGIIDFGFRQPANPAPRHFEVLERTAEAVEAILRFSQNTDVLLDLTARVKELQAELADQKISERALGLLKQSGESDKAGVLRVHVAQVLGSFQPEELLTTQINDLEGSVAERRVIAAAKEWLQRNQGLTEEEAYLLLRAASRRARKKLSELAAEILAGKPVLGLRPEKVLTGSNT